MVSAATAIMSSAQVPWQVIPAIQWTVQEEKCGLEVYPYAAAGTWNIHMCMAVTASTCMCTRGCWLTWALAVLLLAAGAPEPHGPADIVLGPVAGPLQLLADRLEALQGSQE